MLLKGAGYVGGIYLARNYLRDRLEELREKLEAERVARENLRRRFQQTQEDVSYTVLTLLPTLSEQILQTMNVELLTNALQFASKSRNSEAILLPPVDPVGSPEASRLVDSFVSEAGSVSQSWVASGGLLPSRSGSPTPSTSATSSIAASSEENIIQLTASIKHQTSATSVIKNNSTTTPSATPGGKQTTSKAELWHEVKMLTFTRTLTTLYSITLLCLFTNLQLTLLARSKYVASILEQERDERVREQLDAGLTTSNLIFGSLGLGPAAGSRLESLLSGGLDEDDLDGGRVCEGELWRLEGIDADVAAKYLTLSWWLLHVGWKDVGERVRRAVDETLDGVSLKTKIAIMDLHQLIRDVRRRVEREITFEGAEKRTNFLSSLLPPTPETICHVLTQGGYTSAPYPHRSFRSGTIRQTELLPTSQLSHEFANSPAMATSPANPRNLQGQSTFMSTTPPPHIHLLDEPFEGLLSETRSILSSPDFAHVFEVCLDHATEVLFDSLEKNVFRPRSVIEGEGMGEEVRMRLAALLPDLAKWSQLALNGLPNELIDKTLNLREVSCFSALSFSRFEEYIM